MCIRDSCRDLVHGLAFADQSDDLRLCENGALCGDGDDVLCGQCQLRELGKGVNLPSKSVIVPFDVPFSNTLAPMMASPVASLIIPVTVCFCC